MRAALARVGVGWRGSGVNAVLGQCEDGMGVMQGLHLRLGLKDVLFDVVVFVLVNALVFVLVDELGFVLIDVLVVVLVQVLG